MTATFLVAIELDAAQIARYGARAGLSLPSARKAVLTGIEARLRDGTEFHCVKRATVTLTLVAAGPSDGGAGAGRSLRPVAAVEGAS